MALLLFRIRSFIRYWLEAVDEHSLHSPFFFDFYTHRVKPATSSAQFADIENLRRQLLADNRTVPVLDLGSKAGQNAVRKVASIARTTLSTRRFSTLFYRIIEETQATSVVELGTSLGINTLYLARNQQATVTTFEGAPAVADIAARNFEAAGAQNVRLVVGDIDTTLPSFLRTTRHVDFALIDANHRYEPTLRYFTWMLDHVHDRSVVVIDDIHHTPEMEQAWNVIRNHHLVYGSADLFRCGILFFDPSLNKQHVILQV